MITLMTRTVWAGVLVALLLLAGGFLYFRSQKNTVVKSTEDQSTQNGKVADTPTRAAGPSISISLPPLTITRVIPVTATVTTPNGLLIGFVNDPDATSIKTNVQLFIENRSAENSAIDVTGWKIASQSRGLSYVIPKVTKQFGSKGSQPATIAPEEIKIWPRERIYISQSGKTEDNYTQATEMTSYGLYTGSATWSTDHDTITLFDSSGSVLGKLTY